MACRNRVERYAKIMQPITRETITDRRQPHVRWSAVIAGALSAAGIWLVLQLLFTGGALSAIDPEDVDHARAFGIGASVGSMLAPVLAMFAGGLIAGKLAAHYDRKVLGLHGALTWALTSLVGLVLIASAVSRLASFPETRAHLDSAASSAPVPNSSEYLDNQTKLLNFQLKAANAPQITKDQLIGASHAAVTSQGTINRDAFVRELDDRTDLSRPEAEAAINALGDRAPDVISNAHRIGEHREQALSVAQDAGRGMLAAGVGLLICLGAAIGGALLARRLRRDSKPDVAQRDVGLHHSGTNHSVTAPYPTTEPTERNPIVE